MWGLRPFLQALYKSLAQQGSSEFTRPAGWYCVGCEAYKDDSEMEGDHECPTHRKRCIERSEENYFFSLSKYQAQIQVSTPALSKRVPVHLRSAHASNVGAGRQEAG